MSDQVDLNAFNAGVIAEFRANNGVVGGSFAGAPMVLITHRGARSGKEYTTPLVHSKDGDNVVIIASKAGAPEDPQWFRYLVANPEVTVELPGETYLHEFGLPNLYFHHAMAHVALKQAGVVLGKADFDGRHHYPEGYSLG